MNFVYCQDISKKDFKNIGINYFGELGLRPGIEIDFGFPLKIKENKKDNKKKYLSHFIYLRPTLAYFHYPHNSNNFQLGFKFNYQFKTVNTFTNRYLNFEPYLKIAYLRKSFIGEIYETVNEDFIEKNNAGTNSYTLGLGLDFGGYLNQRIDWLFGVEYFSEFTSDQLILHRFLAKLGIRIKLNNL